MICDFEHENNNDDYICNTRNGLWVDKRSERGREIIDEIDNDQPRILNTIINDKARVLRKIGHNRYALIPNYQPRNTIDIDDDKINKKYCGNNSNIIEMIDYLKHINAIDRNPYKYIDTDNSYNCLKKGIYIGENLDDDEDL